MSETITTEPHGPCAVCGKDVDTIASYGNGTTGPVFACIGAHMMDTRTPAPRPDYLANYAGD